MAKTETEASQIVFTALKQRGHPDKPPPTISDGWGGIREAMVEVYGQAPPYSGRGRPPTLKQPGKDWQYLQMVKQRENEMAKSRTCVFQGGIKMPNRNNSECRPR
jgi:hypothetical protein